MHTSSIQSRVSDGGSTAKNTSGGRKKEKKKMEKKAWHAILLFGTGIDSSPGLLSKILRRVCRNYYRVSKKARLQKLLQRIQTFVFFVFFFLKKLNV